MKKICAIHAAMIFVAMLFIFLGISKVDVYAEDESGILVSEDRKYQYRVIDEENKTAEIVYAVPGALTLDPEGDWNVLYIPSVLDDTYTVVSLGDKAFQNIINAHKIVIPNTVTHIGASCFYACTSAEMFEITTSVTSFGKNAFAYTPWILSMRKCRADGLVIVNNVLIDGRACKGDVVIPSGVTAIADGAFNSGVTTDPKIDPYTGSTITGITIPSTVKTIGNMAFISNHKLKKVVLEEGVQSIGAQTFADCQALEEICFSTTLDELGAGAFYRCPMLTAVDLKNTNVTNIPISCFRECVKLSSVSLPEELTDISKMAFYECEALCEFTVTPKVRVIGTKAFYNIDSIKITIPENITDTSGWVLPLGDGIEFLIKAGSSIESFMKENELCYSTYGNTDTPEEPEPEEPVNEETPKLKTPEIAVLKQPAPSKIELYVGSVFGYGRLKYVVTSYGTVKVKGVIKKTYTYIKIPESITYGGRTFKVTSVEISAFSGCKSLVRVIIGDNVLRIGSCAFKGCKALKYVTIGSKVEELGREVFYGDSSIYSMRFTTKRLKRIGKMSFRGIRKTAKIYVPSEKKVLYSKLINGAR